MIVHWCTVAIKKECWEPIGLEMLSQNHRLTSPNGCFWIKKQWSTLTLYRPTSEKSVTGDRWRLEDCNSVIFGLIFKSETPSERSVHVLNVNFLFLKIGPEIALRQPFKVGQYIKIAMFLDCRSIAFLMHCPTFNKRLLYNYFWSDFQN